MFLPHLYGIFATATAVELKLTRTVQSEAFTSHGFNLEAKQCIVGTMAAKIW